MDKRIILSFILLIILVGCDDKKVNDSIKKSTNLKEISLSDIEIIENPNPFANKITKVGEKLKIKQRDDDGYYLDYNTDKVTKKHK